MRETNSRPVVWVTQVPHSKVLRNGETILVPKIDISQAEEHGRIEIMLDPTVSFFATNDMVSILHDKLIDYDYKAGDSVLCLGEPAIIAIVGSLLAERTQSYNLLVWDRDRVNRANGRYLKLKISL